LDKPALFLDKLSDKQRCDLRVNETAFIRAAVERESHGACGGKGLKQTNDADPATPKRPKRLEPRPIVELLQYVSIDDLCRLKVFPQHRHGRSSMAAMFKYPFLKRLVISRQSIDFEHVSGYTQTIGLVWIRCGLGGERPIFVCLECSCGARRLFLHHGRLACKHCVGAVYASQACDQRMRPVLQAIRLRRFLELKGPMCETNIKRLEARIDPNASQLLTVKRLSHPNITMPTSNYRTRGCMNWR